MEKIESQRRTEGRVSRMVVDAEPCGTQEAPCTCREHGTVVLPLVVVGQQLVAQLQRRLLIAVICPRKALVLGEYFECRVEERFEVVFREVVKVVWERGTALGLADVEDASGSIAHRSAEGRVATSTQ